MIRRIKPIFLTAGIFLLGLVLTGCGGGGDTPPENVTAPNVGLASLALEGYDIDFDSSRTGTYSVTVAADVSEVQLTAVSANDVARLAYSVESTLGQGGSATIEDLESGVPVTLSVGAGDNIITVYIFDDDAVMRGEYFIQVHRISTTATLLHARFIDLVTTDDVTLAPIFESDHFDYSADIGYTRCALEGVFFSNERNTTIAVNGERVSHAQRIPFPLDIGENVFETVVTAEDGVTTETYNFTVTRAEPTEELLEENPTLAGLTLSTGDVRFVCSITDYGVVISRDTTAVDIIATTAADEATMTINDQVVVSGEPYNLVLEDGANEVEIEVTAPNGETTLTYELTLQRVDTNIVNVDTVEELQAALLNAEPGDEIRVAGGRYEGVASVDTSGSDSAHFYSDRSGVADDLIQLVGVPSTEPVVLAGMGTSANAVLQLTGDYWRIAGMQFSNARNGIVLSNASNNRVSAVSVRGTGEHGIIIRDGSTGNIINNVLVGETGVDIATDRTGHAEGILVGSDDSEWASEPGGAGLYNEQDHNNVIRNSEFLSTIASEAIEVNEGTLGTIIEHNIFTSGSLTNVAGDSSLINIQGNDVVVRYNTFYYKEDENLAEVISVNDDSADWNTDTSWGENAKIYQNLFVLKDRQIPLVASEGVDSVLVADNTRDDSLDPTYAGTGIDQSFSTPIYKIQPAGDESVCLDVETVEETLVNQATNETRVIEIDSVSLNECSSATSQLWHLVMEKDKYIRIQNAQFSQNEVGGTQYEAYVTPRRDFGSSCRGIAGEEVPPLRINSDFDGFIQRWGTVLNNGGIEIINKYLNNIAVTVPEQFEVGGPVTACGTTVVEDERQTLRLIEQ